MRVVIASGNPALALALSTQLPGIEARSASSPSTARDLASDDALVLLDLGSTEETTDWLNHLRSWGVDNGIVVVDAPSVSTEGLVTHLSRPFSVADLAAALDRTFAEQAERHRAAEPHDEIGDAKPAGVASDSGAVDVDGVPPPSPAVMDVDEVPAAAPPTFERPPEPARRSRSSGFARRTADEPGRPEPGQSTNRVPDSAASVRQGLQAANTLERLLGDMSILGSVASCGALLWMRSLRT